MDIIPKTSMSECSSWEVLQCYFTGWMFCELVYRRGCVLLFFPDCMPDRVEQH